MFDSGLTVANFITDLKSEVDISQEIGNSTILRWVSSLEQLLYSDIILFEKYEDVTSLISSNLLYFSDLDVQSWERYPEFDDILKVFCNGVELTKSGPIAGVQFYTDKQIYVDNNAGGLEIFPFETPEKVEVIWRNKPAIKSDTTDDIMVPYEWIEMVYAKLRGECYKLANDDQLAAKWLNDYNNQLESFKVWIAEHRKRFGE